MTAVNLSAVSAHVIAEGKPFRGPRVLRKKPARTTIGNHPKSLAKVALGAAAAIAPKMENRKTILRKKRPPIQSILMTLTQSKKKSL